MFLTSATLVDTTTFHPLTGANTRRCSSLERFACKGSTSVPEIPRSFSAHCRISCTPGKKIRMAPRSFDIEVICWTRENMSYGVLVGSGPNKRVKIYLVVNAIRATNGLDGPQTFIIDAFRSELVVKSPPVLFRFSSFLRTRRS